MSTDQALNRLLQKFIHKTITRQELQELRQMTNHLDTHVFMSQLEDVWQLYSPDSDMNRERLNVIKEEMDSMLLQPAEKIRVRPFNRFMRIAAMIAFPLLMFLSVFLYMDNQQLADSKTGEMMVKVEKGQRASVVLPDGSRIQLNTESRLSYDGHFGDKVRRVSLDGEAYLEIAKNKDVPFIVNTQDLEIEVLGTTFCIYSYSYENTVEASLIEGRVKVTAKSSNRVVTLEPNQKVIYNKETKALETVHTDNRFETAWLKGDLVFRSEPFCDVMTKIERRYGVKIHINEDRYYQDRFTGNFGKDQNIQDVFTILKMQYPFDVKINCDDVYITYH